MRFTVNIRGLYIAISLLMASTHSLRAQQYNWVLSDFGRIKTAYKDTGYLSYTIQYSYSSKKAGGEIADSLLITCKSHGNSYYSKIGAAEFVQNPQYNVAVHHERKSIVINNPVVKESGILSAINIDSAFLQNHVDSVLVTENKESKTIRLLFGAASRFRFYTITFSKKSFLIEKINYCVKQPGEEGEEGDMDELTFTLLFSQYDRRNFDDNFFSEKAYVQKNAGGDFKGTGEYSRYEIMNIKDN